MRAGPLSKTLILLSVWLSSGPTNASSETMENLIRASVELKKAHVLRYYDKCKSQNKSDEMCRKELEELHPREVAALTRIKGKASKYDQVELSGALAGCYDPSHDYKDLIECWERLASRMEAGGRLNIEPVGANGSPPDGADEKLSSLTSFEQRSVVLCVRGKISINYRDTVAPNLKAGGDKALWALKVTGLESLQMSELAKAASWAEMESYYKMEAMNVQLLIRQGPSGYDSYVRASKLNEGNLKQVLKPEIPRQSEHARNFEKYASVCQGISSAIIGTAKAP